MEQFDYQQQKQERLERRSEERSRHKAKSRRDTLKKVFAVFIVVAVCVGLIGSVIGSLGRSTTNITPVEPGTFTPVSSTDWIRGKTDSSITFVEYGDFQCPACSVYYSLIKQLEKEYGDKVAFVFRHYPLTQVHRNALSASFAAEAAGQQGKFWEMHDLLFENQAAWSANGAPENIFAGYASDLKLDVEKFKTDLQSSSVQQKISSNQASGDAVGVNSTPSFFLNGARIENPRSYEEFKKIFDGAISADSKQ